MRAFLQRIVWSIRNLMRPGVTVWHYSLIHPSAKIGRGTCIGSFCEIGPNVVIGENCRIGAKVFIPEGVTIGNGCFIGPGTTFSNDMYPPSSGPQEGWLKKTYVEDGASLGAAVSVRPGVRIAAGTMVGTGAVMVTMDGGPNQTWTGNPARPLVKYTEVKKECL